MIALTSLILAGVTHFGGGTVNQLADSLAQATGKDAIIVTGAPVDLKAFDYDAGSADNLSTTMKAGTGLLMAPGSAPYFSDRVFVASHFREIAPQLPELTNVSQKVPDDMLQDGKVTLDTGAKTSLAVEALATVKWSHPLRIDFLLKDLAISASVKGMKERDFLNAVALAAGAFVTVDDKGYHMEYDGELLRARVQNTLKHEADLQPKQDLDAKRHFYSAVVGDLPSSDLLVIFQQPANTPRMDVVPNSPVAAASIEYIKELQAIETEKPESDLPAVGGQRFRPGRANRNVPQDLLQRIDNRAAVHLRLNANGTIVLSVPVVRGRSSQYIDL